MPGSRVERLASPVLPGWQCSRCGVSSLADPCHDCSRDYELARLRRENRRLRAELSAARAEREAVLEEVKE